MKIMSLGAIALMVQPIFSFCIYNNMNEDTKVLIAQKIILLEPFKTFQTTLSPNDKACCHYSNRDCSPLGNDNDNARFLIQFSSGKQMSVSCDTGGAISFQGTGDDPTAICTGVDGNDREAGLE